MGSTSPTKLQDHATPQQHVERHDMDDSWAVFDPIEAAVFGSVFTAFETIVFNVTLGPFSLSVPGEREVAKQATSPSCHHRV